ncbi:cytochrome c oxidase assembly protein [Microbacterium sp. W4I20]|uniref:cytochrome c oxidase assembly protein n=1 Tax=Microbacterium sp. W4I20 TaxID=3042262 RepID=UPI002781B7C4|nr:cytochrome c oxidase assembly protein [Microbacterium sp. W4I20]MDQ0729130.1 putative membrane protein [Microbacterium sp. W4I20]
MHGHADGDNSFGQWIILLPLAAAAVMYVAAAVGESGKGRPWPWWRTSFWLLGLGVAAFALSGTSPSGVGRPFTDHAIGHLLVGMAAPVFLVLAAPVTLALRNFAVLSARRLSHALRSPPARLLSHPIIAALLSIGSLYLLYLTPLYESTTDSVLHLAVMVHFLITGFLFTASIITVDPSPHRSSMNLRLIVLTLSLAAHGVLTKALYASAVNGESRLAQLVQTEGVSPSDLQAGAQLMYYGGDVVDLVLIAIVLFGWYRSTIRPATRRTRMSRRTHIAQGGLG